MRTMRNATCSSALLGLLLFAAAVAAGCSGKKEEVQTSGTPAQSTAAPAATATPAPEATPASGGGPAQQPDEPLPEVGSPYDALPESARSVLDKPFTGDFDEMVKRRLIRAGVTFNRTHYFIDKGVQRGIAYDALKLFEDEVNARLKTGNLRVHVAFVPLPRDLLLPALVEGKVDLVAAQLTVTPERQKLVDFSDPTRPNVSEIVVTGPGSPAIATLDDLAGHEVFVRKTSSYHDSLHTLNGQLKARGKPPVAVHAAPENLEDDDLLEMVNAGLVPITVVDDYLAEFWKQVFPDLKLHPAVALRTGGNLAVAVRKSNPKLKNAANLWIKKYGPRSAFGNVVERKYLENTQYAKGATSEAERRKFRAVVKLFEKYAGQYKLDYLLMAAQGYQESRLDHSVRSPVGAIGVMQVMPATGKELKVGDIRQLEPNIHAGVKYFRFMMDQYFAGEPMNELDKGLMTFAAYNAGPGRLRQLRREAERRGLDPNVWFGNVERIASERIGRETVQYVANIYKYYVAYRLVVDEMRRREEAKSQLGARPGS